MKETVSQLFIYVDNKNESNLKEARLLKGKGM